MVKGLVTEGFAVSMKTEDSARCSWSNPELEPQGFLRPGWSNDPDTHVGD